MQLNLFISYDTDGNWKLYVVDTKDYLEYGTLGDGCEFIRSIQVNLHLPEPIAPIAVVKVPDYVGNDSVAATVTIE